MFKKIIFLVCFGGFVVLFATGAMAFGIGGYMTFGGGNAKFDINQYELFSTESMRNSHNLAIGGGLILDTNLAYDRIFNYRLKLGGEQNSVEREAEIKMTRLSMDHVFGFGVVRTRSVRLWFGPQIGLSYSWGNRREVKRYFGFSPISFEWQAINLGMYSPLFFMEDILRDKINKIEYGGIDVGLVVGLNINIGETVTIGPEIGCKYVYNWGKQNRDIYDWVAPLDVWSGIPININDNRESLKLRGYELFATISIMFRVSGDNYQD
jgi:hypothetical protein